MKPVRITDASQLAELVARRGLFSPSQQVVLELRGLPGAERERWEVLLNRRLSACGCGDGAILMILSLAGYAAYLVFGPGEAPGFWAAAGIGLAIAMVATLVGKIAGLVRARMLLTRAIRNLEAATR